MSTTQSLQKNITIAVLYADADEQYWKELQKHLNLLTKMHPNVRLWTIKDVELGAAVKQEVRQELSRADITLLLLSADFAIENVFDEETRILLSNYAANSGRGRYIMPVIVQDFMWRDHYDSQYDIEKLKFFDRILKEPENRDAIYREITETLNQYIKEINTRNINIVIPTWVGFMGGIMYNNGFARSRQTPLFKKYQRGLRYQLSDNVEETCDLMMTGQADLIWATLDRLPSVIHKLKDRSPKVIAQVSWSNGADAIVARNGIETVADLKGKKVIYPYDSPALTFLKYALHEAGMDTFDVAHQAQKDLSLDALMQMFRHDDTIDAVVMWSPYVESCLAEIEGTRVVADTSKYPNLITDVLVTTKEFLDLNREELRMLFRGWFAEVDKFASDPFYRTGGINVLIEAIISPLPAIIPTRIREELVASLLVYFESSLDKVHLSTLEDNQEFFAIAAGEETSPAGRLYQQFLEFQFPDFLLDLDVQWEQIVDASIVETEG